MSSNIHEFASQACRLRFEVPTAYRCERITGSLLALRCQYPSMGPTTGDDPDRDNSVLIFIAISDGPSRADQLVTTAALEPDNDRSCQHYFAGQQGPFSIYRRSDMADAVFHVFRARDGTRVCVEDAGNWSSIYAVYRKLGAPLNLHYEMPKSVGCGFMQFDEAVATFVRGLHSVAA